MSISRPPLGVAEGNAPGFSLCSAVTLGALVKAGTGLGQCHPEMFHLGLKLHHNSDPLGIQFWIRSLRAADSTLELMFVDQERKLAQPLGRATRASGLAVRCEALLEGPGATIPGQTQLEECLQLLDPPGDKQRRQSLLCSAQPCSSDCPHWPWGWQLSVTTPGWEYPPTFKHIQAFPLVSWVPGRFPAMLWS